MVAKKKAIQFEQEHQSAQLSIKHLEESQCHYKQFLEEAQESIDSLQQDKDSLIGLKHTLEKQLQEKTSQLEKYQVTVLHDEKLLEKLEIEKDSAITDCGQLRKALLFAEQSLTKLSTEHDSLQKSLTDSQKEGNIMKAKLSSLSATKNKLEKQIEDGEKKIVDLQNKVKTITLMHNSKKEEAEMMCEVLGSTREEKNKLKMSLSRLEEASIQQQQECLCKIAGLEKSVDEMKLQNNELVKALSNSEVSLERKKRKLTDQSKELETLKNEKMSTDLELEQAIEMYKDACMAYNQLGIILESAFDENFLEEFKPISEELEDAERKEQLLLNEASCESGFTSPDPLVPGFAMSCSLDHAPVLSGIKIKALSVCKVQQAIFKLRLATSEHQKSTEELQQRFDVLQEQHNISQLFQSTLEKEIVGLTQSLNVSKSAYKESNSANENLQKTIASQCVEMEKMKIQIDSLSSEVKQLEEELEVSKLNTETNEASISDFANKIMKLEADRTKAIGELEQSQITVYRLEEKVMDLKKNESNLQNTKKIQEAEISRLSKQSQSLCVSLDSVEKHLTEAQVELDQLNSLLQSSNEKKCKLDLEVQKLSEKCQMLETDCKVLTTKLAEITDSLKISKLSEASLAMQVEKALSSKHDEEMKASCQLQEVKMKMEKLEEDLALSESLKVSFEASVRDLSSKKAQLEEELVEHQSTERSLKKDVEKLECTLKSEKVKREIGDELYKGMQRENEKLQRILKETKDKKQQAEEELQESLLHKQNVEDLTAKQSKYTRQLAAATKRNVELMSQIKELEKKASQQEENHVKE